MGRSEASAKNWRKDKNTIVIRGIEEMIRYLGKNRHVKRRNTHNDAKEPVMKRTRTKRMI